jgi:pimeloyl-ACP methyl ester carboxylesterase
MIENAPTFLDETRDPEQLTLDLARLAGTTLPLLLTTGAQSPPIFAPVVARIAAALPAAEVPHFPDAGHVPHATHPEAYVAVTLDFIARHADRGRAS